MSAYRLVEDLVEYLNTLEMSDQTRKEIIRRAQEIKNQADSEGEAYGYQIGVTIGDYGLP